MSENHESLFASAVPGNGTSSTLGSNGAGRSNERQVNDERQVNPAGEIGNARDNEPVASRETRHQQHLNASPAPEDGNNGNDRLDLRGNHLSRGNDESPGVDEVDKSNQGGDGNPEDKSIEYMDEVVDCFRRDEITKLKALSNIISILDFNPSRTERAKDAAVEYYAKTLDEVEALASSAIKRGHHAEIGLQSSHNRLDKQRGPRNVDTDRAIDDLVSQISRESNKSKRNNSPGHSDSDNDLDEPSNKKRRVFESEMPWYNREEEARQSGNKDCEESRRILQLFARDYKIVRQWIQTSRTAPLGFPSSEWDNVIKGQAVNLDAVFSSLHHISAPKENVGRVGSTEISLGQSEPAKKVQTSGEWTSAWNACIKAIKFAFPHREQELRDYGEYIEGHFSAKVPSAHRKVILYDTAIRNEVGGGQNALLTDTHRFTRFYSAIIMPDGIESDHVKLSPKRSTPKGLKTEICNRFNSVNGCRNSADDCRFKHACKRCKRLGHGKEHCDVKEGSST
jgi:hypothetical protein